MPAWTSDARRSGSRWKAGQRSGWASTRRCPRAWRCRSTLSNPAADGVSGDSTSSQGPPPSDSPRSSSSPSSATRVIASSPPWSTSSGRPSAASAALTSATPVATCSALVGMSQVTCGVASTRLTPAATCARARASEASMVGGPSSTPGRMWQWMSITLAYDRARSHATRGDRVFKSIVVGTDGSETATEAVRQAVDLAKEIGAKIELVSAYEPVSDQRLREERTDVPDDLQWMVNPREDVDATLKEAAEVAKEAGVNVETYARQGDPADAILDVAEEQNADLIIVGNKGMTGAKRFLLGSVPNKVSHHAPCSVLIIRTT